MTHGAAPVGFVFFTPRPAARVARELTMSTDPILGASQPLIPPLYPASVYTLPDLDALDGHPNAQDLAARIATLEHAQWGIVTSSGMGAISASLLALLQTGDRVV